jgi:hypothetical protein
MVKIGTNFDDRIFKNKCPFTKSCSTFVNLTDHVMQIGTSLPWTIFMDFFSEKVVEVRAAESNLSELFLRIRSSIDSNFLESPSEKEGDNFRSTSSSTTQVRTSVKEISCSQFSFVE